VPAETGEAVPRAVRSKSRACPAGTAGPTRFLSASTVPLRPSCEPTAHRLLFSANASLTKWRSRPPVHRSPNGIPDRQCIAQIWEGAFPLITAPAFAVLPCFRLQTRPRATTGGRDAEVATNDEGTTNCRFSTRALAVPADLQGGDAVAAKAPLGVSDALSVRT